MGPDVSGSVIGLIIDASIPAGAGRTATNMSREGRGGFDEGDINGGANKGRHLECCIAASHTHTHARTRARIHGSKSEVPYG